MSSRTDTKDTTTVPSDGSSANNSTGNATNRTATDTATRTLIESIGNGQLSLSSTMPLARAILETSSIVVGSASSSATLQSSISGLAISSSKSQESASSAATDGSSSAVTSSSGPRKSSLKVSTKIMKRLERNYRQRVSAASSKGSSGDGGVGGDVDVERTMKEVESLFKQLARREGDEYANNIMGLMSRLAGIGAIENVNKDPNRERRSSRTKRSTKSNTLSSSTTTMEDAKRVTFKKNEDDDSDTNDESTPQTKEFPPIGNPSITDLKNRTFVHEKNAIRDEEMKILAECIYALQYIDGENLRFRQISQKTEKKSAKKRQSTANTMDHYDGLHIRPGLLPFHLDSATSVEHKSTRLLTSGAKDALKICGEAGWLYNRIRNYIDTVLGSSSRRQKKNHGNGGGVVSRALASTLASEMQSYQYLLSALEYQLQTANPVELTARRLVLQLRGPINQLRSLAMLVDGIDTHLNGGKLLTALHLHSMHGDIRHGDLVNRILYTTSIPWYDLLYDWAMKGLLPCGLPSKASGNGESVDTNSEFFIQVDDSVDLSNMWHGRYILCEDQIPHLMGVAGGGILSKSLAKEILVVGKGINFIRQCLSDSEWNLDIRDLCSSKDSRRFTSIMNVETLDEETRKQMKATLGFFYDNQSRSSFDLGGCTGVISTRTPLERTITAAARQVHKHILDSLFYQHHLIQHLHGMKNILFLGQGDFISALMDSLNDEFDLDRGTDGIYMHSMMGILHDALRSTNARCLPQYVLERIHVRLLTSKNTSENQFWIEESFNDKKEDGWDVFSLGYEMDAPLNAVVHREAMKKYELVFSLLFRLKRIEWLLNSTWRQGIILNHSICSMLTKYGDFATHESSVVRIKWLLRRYSMTGQAMIHFVTNFQSYMMFEVLENGFTQLVSEIGNSKTLDEVIRSHNKYLDTIVIKSLLGDMHAHRLGKQLRLVLTLIYRFCSMHDSIFSKALASIQATNSKRQRAENRAKDGNWGFEKIDADVEGYNISELSNEDRLREIVEIDKEFDTALQRLLSMLNDKVNEVVDAEKDSMSSKDQLQDRDIMNSNDTLRFLTFRLDFSDYYRNKL